MDKGKIKGSKDHSFAFKEKIVNEYSINAELYLHLQVIIQLLNSSVYEFLPIFIFLLSS